MSYLLNGDRIIMGTDYYPEHWDRSMWEEDLERMLETGIEVIRIAEFAWNKFEPREGEYTWDFFDEFLDLCEKKGNAGDFLHAHRNSARMDDGSVSGGSECEAGRRFVPAWCKAALQL